MKSTQCIVLIINLNDQRVLYGAIEISNRRNLINTVMLT